MYIGVNDMQNSEVLKIDSVKLPPRSETRFVGGFKFPVIKLNYN